MPLAIYSSLGVRVGKRFIQALLEEGVVFDSGNCWVTFSTDYLTGPGFLYKHTRRLSRGRFILTNKRLVAIIGGYKVIDIPRHHEDFNYLSFDKRQEKRYEIIVDYNQFSGEIKGKVIFSYHIKPFEIEDF